MEIIPVALVLKLLLVAVADENFSKSEFFKKVVENASKKQNQKTIVYSLKIKIRCLLKY